MVAPAAAEPDWVSVDWVEVLPDALPEAAPWLLVDDDALGAWPLEVVPLVAEPLVLVDGDVLLLVEGEVPPVALLPVLPEALPEPEDWLVCAPWFIVEDGLVVVALWLADTPLEVFWSPVPMFTPGLTFAPTFASTPTFGFTFTPPDGAVVEPLELEGCEDWVDCELCSVVEDDWANAGPNAPITAAAVILTARCLNLMTAPFVNVDAG